MAEEKKGEKKGAEKDTKEKKGSSADVEALVDGVQRDITKLRQEVGKMIVGHEEIVEGVVMCLLADGQVLLEGVPGLGKTMLVRTLSEALDCDFSRIQFTPDMMPADILGTNMIVEDEHGGKHFEFQKGPIFTNILLADEVNRATPKTQAALLEAMQEKSVTIGNTTYKLDPPFFVLATQNPLEMEGTYPLPEAQLDRFLFKLNVKFPSRDELHLIMERTTAKDTPKVEVATKKSRILEMRLMAREVPVARHVMDYALKLIQATHPNLPEAVEATRRYVRFGSSPRGAQAIIITAKIRALMQGRFNVSVEDVRHTAMAALRHRIILNFEGEAEGVQTDEILQEIIKKTAETKP
ncbi:MAG: AAA family ATPase [Deltaproteobacteria bacterium CG_4_9_14_3_um_filter_63_12]|nr:MAG: AAA family ATPase [Deltaproteobacteria bacterium CG_4_9_14_3_um_filter_63_12]